MKKFDAEIVWLSPQELTPYQNNTKKHPTEQVDKIAQQIAAVGFDQPIVVDAERVIIKGHGRREAAMRLGLDKVPVIVREDLTEYEVKAARIADNKVAESEWDKDMLKFELGTLQHHDIDLKLTGFDLKEVEKMLKEEDEFEVEEEEQAMVDDAKEQFIVAVNCKDETEMQAIFDELSARGLDCKLIT